MNIKKLLIEFMSQVGDGKIDVYNEFSLQHELGIFLRANLSEYKVQFERNTKFFEIHETAKHEIDIVVYNDLERYAIELKFPQNGQYPEQMFSFVKDIKFMEEMKEAGFNRTYCLTLVADKNFYSLGKQDGIYAFFRAEKPVCGIVTKPTGEKSDEIKIKGSYIVNWKDCGENKYYLIEI